MILDSSLSDAATTVLNVKQKNLRSLNDVLGKKSRKLKVAKNSNGNWVLLNVFNFYYNS